MKGDGISRLFQKDGDGMVKQNVKESHGVDDMPSGPETLRKRRSEIQRFVVPIK